MDIIDSLFVIGMALLFIFIGLWGLLNFEKFLKFYFNFLDSINIFNIKYPKGTYARVTFKLTFGFTLIIGLIMILCFILAYLNNFSVIDLS